MTAFILSMPNVGSWNGKWTGEKSLYVVVKRLNKDAANSVEGYGFSYDFGDGWRAKITVEKIDSKTAAKYRRASKGFCGYEWMINSILEHGRITTDGTTNG